MSTGSTIDTRSGKSQIVIHQGEALKKVAATYGNIMAVILEHIQNALDADATNVVVEIKVDLFGTITISDNGNGVDEVMFNKALGSIFKSIKERGKLGRFGIGMVSAIGKCRKFLFTSCRMGTDVYRQWTFDSNKLTSREVLDTIPWRRQSLHFDPASSDKEAVSWRTQITIAQYGTSKTFRLFSLDKLETEILARYGQAMRSKSEPVRVILLYKPAGSTETINRLVMSSQFPGTKLEEVVYTLKNNRTTFNIFVLGKDGRKRQGEVLLSAEGDPFTLPFSVLGQSEIVRSLLPSVMMEAMNSGFFGGLITNSKIVPASNRTEFDEEADNAIFDLCHHLNSWWKEHGLRYYEEMKEFQRDNRYQDLALRAIESFRKALQENKTLAEMLEDIFKKLKGGGDEDEGEGHVRRRLKQPIEPKQDAKDTTPKENDRSPKDPLSAEGPNGSRKPSGPNSNFSFGYEMAEGEAWLWRVDLSQGKIIINIKHTIWVDVDAPGKSQNQRDQALVRLQIQIGIHAILVLSEEDVDKREYLKSMLEHQMEMLGYFLRHDSEGVSLPGKAVAD